MTLHLKVAMSDSQRYPWSPHLIKNVEDIVVFINLKVFNSDNSQMFSCNRNAQISFAENSHVKLISFQNQKHWYLIYASSDKALKGIVVNRALSSLNGESLEITLTVPLRRKLQGLKGLNMYTIPLSFPSQKY